MNYDLYRERQIENGKVYQDFVADLFYASLGFPISQYSSKLYQQHVGESRAGVEIKYQHRYKETGNLWIELAEKARPRPGLYAASGINRHDNSWLFATGDFDTVFVFAMNVLRGVSKRYRQLENNTKTSVGFLIPDTDARKYSSVILEPGKSATVQKFLTQCDEAVRELLSDVNRTQLRLFE